MVDSHTHTHTHLSRLNCHESKKKFLNFILFLFSVQYFCIVHDRKKKIRKKEETKDIYTSIVHYR